MSVKTYTPQCFKFSVRENNKYLKIVLKALTAR